MTQRRLLFTVPSHERTFTKHAAKSRVAKENKLNFTEAEVRSLSAEKRGVGGWPGVPKSIPQRFLQSVLEFRHRVLQGIKEVAKPKPVVEAMATTEDMERFRRRYSLLTR